MWLERIGVVFSALFVVLTFEPLSASAQEEPGSEEREAFALHYEVEPGCPVAEQFIEELGALTRAARIVSSESDDADRQLTIQVRKEVSEFGGAMRLEDEHGESKRTISGATCDEVVSALALAVALAVDPNALGGAAPEPKPISEETKSVPPEEARSAEAKDKPDLVAEKAAKKAVTPVDSRDSHRLWMSASYLHGFWLVEAADDSGQLETRVRSRRELVGGIEIQLPRRLGGASFGVELGGAWGEVSDVDFSWTPSVRLFACPYWFQGHSWFRFSACLGGDFAVQRNAASSEFEQAQSASRPYAGIDTMLRFAFVRGVFRAELQGGVEMPLIRTEYPTLNSSGESSLAFQTGFLPIPTLAASLGWNIF